MRGINQLGGQGKKVGAAVAVLLVLAGAGYWYFGGSAITGPGAAPGAGAAQPVYAAAAKTEVFGDRIEAIGTLLANESINVTAKIQGVIRSLDFQDGAAVEVGAQIASIASGEEDAKVKAELANLDEQRQTLERITDLAKSKNVSPARVDEQVAAVRKAEANLAAASARAGDFRIRAPFAGVLGTRRVSLGALVVPGTVITTLDDTSVMKLDFAVPENFIAALKPGLDVEATTDAYQGQLFKGQVISVDSRIDPLTRAVNVRAALPNPERRLRPGMLMVLDLIKDQRQSLMIPEQALLPDGKKQFVNLIGAADDVKKVEVTVGRRTPGFVEILAGLKDGDLVVTEGSMQLRPGAKVRVLPQGDGAPLAKPAPAP